MMNKLQNELLNAMIGLVRAADKNGKTAETDRVLLEGVKAVRDDTVSAAHVLRVREEKAKAAPGCALCAMPCGSTADADMDAVWQEEAQAVALKKDILELLYGAADVLLQKLNSGTADERTLYLFHKGLFFIGEYVEAQELKGVLAELEPLRTER